MPRDVSNEFAPRPNEVKQQSQRQSADERSPIASGTKHVLELAQQENKRQQGTKQSHNSTPRRGNAGNSNCGKRSAPNIALHQCRPQAQIQPVLVNDDIRRKSKNLVSFRQSGMHAGWPRERPARRALPRGARHAGRYRRRQPEAGTVQIRSEEAEVDCHD